MKKNLGWVIGAVAVLAAIVLLIVFLGNGNNGNSTALENAKVAWAASGRTDTPEAVYYMHYKGADSMATSVANPDPSVALIPESGYAYLLAPVKDGESVFSDMMLIFVGENGKVLSKLQWSELNDATTQTGVGAYLNAANYVAALRNHCLSNAVAIQGREVLGTWYTFSAEQITAMTEAK